jgi:hypothetical protein
MARSVQAWTCSSGSSAPGGGDVPIIHCAE